MSRTYTFFARGGRRLHAGGGGSKFITANVGVSCRSRGGASQRFTANGGVSRSLS